MDNWKNPAVLVFIVSDQAYADKEQKDGEVKHQNIQEPPVVDVTRQLLRSKQIQADLSDHFDNVDNLVSLRPQLYVCLLA